MIVSYCTLPGSHLGGLTRPRSARRCRVLTAVAPPARRPPDRIPRTAAGFGVTTPKAAGATAGWGWAEPPCDRRPGSEPRVHRLALQGQDAEDALVDPPQRLLPHEPFQPLHAQGELAQGERPLPA